MEYQKCLIEILDLTDANTRFMAGDEETIKRIREVVQKALQPVFVATIRECVQDRQATA